MSTNTLQNNKIA